MNRYDVLIGIYAHLDTIYAGLILLAVWVATTGHLIDWVSVRGWRVIIPIYWSMLVIAYATAIIFIGLAYS
jgi:hypothetical protein